MKSTAIQLTHIIRWGLAPICVLLLFPGIGAAEEPQPTLDPATLPSVDELKFEGPAYSSGTESPPLVSPSMDRFVSDPDDSETQWEPLSAESDENSVLNPTCVDLKTSDSGNLPVPRYVLERVRIKGNHKTMEHVVKRYIELSVGEVFRANDKRLERTRYRLLSSGLFHRVDLSLEKGSQRGWVVLRVRVKERNTIVIQKIVAGVSEITGYGSVDVRERSFLGTEIDVSAAVVAAKKQYGYRLRFADDHFLNSDFGLRAEGLYAHARDFFGHSDICINSCEPTGRGDAKYATLYYDRAGLRMGTSYSLPKDAFFLLDFRFEEISANRPKAASHESFGYRRPIIFGHLLPGHSLLTSLIVGVVRDTRDNIVLPSAGQRSAFSVELSTEMVGSDYEFSKFVLSHDEYFPLGRGHSIKLGVFAGFIMGDAPFFDQFFVGDFSSFIPSRVLDMNFSHLQPNLLKTSVQEMRYEDLAASINVEYSIPFYRGHGFFYGVDGFVGVGLFMLTSRYNLRVDSEEYEGYKSVPLDLTADLGIRIDTKVGPIVVSLANLFSLIPSVGEGAAEE